ncbi:MAG: GIY-YIG nuclease family protein [Rhodospirillales bacterium]|nr:GIY-YIG nuclease family protein [Rhodospirillales bacterium]
MKQPAVYIMANKPYGTLYTGVTSDLPKRGYEHKNGITAGFTSKHKCHTLVYFAVFDDMEAAITEEKRIKGGNRKKKLALIEGMNPDWRDLYQDIT